MQLEEQFYESSTARWKRELPWLRIFRGFRIAMDFRKLLLALVGTLFFAAGMILFTLLPYSPHAAENAQLEGEAPAKGSITSMFADSAISSWPWDEDFPGSSLGREMPSIRQVVYEPWSIAEPILNQARTLLAPWRLVLEPAHAIVFATSWSGLAWGWTKLLWTLAVWAVFGGAIARIAALELAGEGIPSLKESLSHSCRFFFSTIGGVLLPVVGVGLFWTVALVIGLLGLIPGVGLFLTGLLWFISLICGALLALILIGVAASWPLMYVTIAVEGSDAFDALSRSYSYVFSRPWYGLWIGIVSLLYGAVVLMFLHAAMFFAMHLANHATRVGMGEENYEKLWDRPQVMATENGEVAPKLETPPLGGKLRAAWAKGFMTLSTVFVYSYFWVAMTIAYFLLRHSEDATPFKKVFWAPPAPPTNEPALSGVAAAEYRERQAADGAGLVTPAAPPPSATNG